MADGNVNENENVKTREEKLSEVHDASKVYARVNGGNDEITFDARIEKIVDGVKKDEKVPVTTLNNNKMESHFFFDKAPETKAE